MSKRATATFEIKTWDEEALEEIEGAAKLARVNATTSLKGNIVGEGTQEYLMTYGEDGSAHFVGLERVHGRIGEKSGSFVLQHNGTFTNGVAKSDFLVVPGSGMGELRGLHGQGSYATDSRNSPLSLNYSFD